MGGDKDGQEWPPGKCQMAMDMAIKWRCWAQSFVPGFFMAFILVNVQEICYL